MRGVKSGFVVRKREGGRMPKLAMPSVVLRTIRKYGKRPQRGSNVLHFGFWDGSKYCRRRESDRERLIGSLEVIYRHFSPLSKKIYCTVEKKKS